MKCQICEISLDGGREYLGHMIIQHEYPVSWLERMRSKQDRRTESHVEYFERIGRPT